MAPVLTTYVNGSTSLNWLIYSTPAHTDSVTVFTLVYHGCIITPTNETAYLQVTCLCSRSVDQRIES